MKIEGRITCVTRTEMIVNGVAGVYATATVALPRGETPTKTLVSSAFSLYGYEPEVVFKIGQKVTVEVEEG